MPEKRKKPEILAPAGSLEAFFAAMENGADAVYAGLREFSARAKAKNFSLPQMERITAYAHSLNRKVYVTLNTLVKEAELPPLVDTLAGLAEMRTDGVILQDPGVYRLIREHFPTIPLHASTQMTIHNVDGVKQLEEMGFSRIVLARELHIDDIREIVRSTSAEIECFIHGALCFCFSGQCYFSSFLGGHSGNRGRCTQPCRRLYRIRGKEGYYLSPNDFSSIELIPQLADAGVASLKIEGRMKTAEYVANVVAAYRMAVDAGEGERKEVMGKAKELLKASLGRVPTKGFLASRTPTDIATPSLKGATGRFLGEIRRAAGGEITFETRDRLHVGDRIRVQPKSDRSGKAFTVRELFIGKDSVKAARERSTVTVPCPFPFGVGDTVFKVSSETAFTMSEAACQRKLEAAGPEKIPVALEVGWEGGKMIVAAELRGERLRREFDLGDLEEARTENMAGVLEAQFSRTGDTPFTLASLSAPGFPRVAIPPARLKEIRRSLFAGLREELLERRRERTREARERALASLAAEGAPQQLREENILKGERPEDLSLLTEGIDAVVLPVSRRNLHSLQGLARRLRGKEERLIWHLPFIMLPEELAFYREAVALIREAGFRRFEASNLGHFRLLKGMDAEITCDYRLFSLNSEALRFWSEQGAMAATLYMEDDRENMARLLRAAVPIRRRALLYSGVPAITSRIQIKEAKGREEMQSDRGDLYAIETREGLTHLTPARLFSLTAYRAELRRLGCSSFVADLSQVPAERRRQVLEAFLRGTPIPGTSEFNYVAGLV